MTDATEKAENACTFLNLPMRFVLACKQITYILLQVMESRSAETVAGVAIVMMLEQSYIAGMTLERVAEALDILPWRIQSVLTKRGNFSRLNVKVAELVEGQSL